MKRIRAHHLLCLASFRGEGYSPSFVANMRTVYRWAREGGEGELVASPDAICEACHLTGECGAEQRDRRLLEATGWQVGEIVSVNARVRALIPERERWMAIACPDCPWLEFCRTIEPGF